MNSFEAAVLARTFNATAASGLRQSVDTNGSCVDFRVMTVLFCSCLTGSCASLHCVSNQNCCSSSDRLSLR